MNARAVIKAKEGNVRKGISIAVGGANIPRDRKNHAFALFLAHNEEQKLVREGVRLVAAKVVLLKIILAGVKIQNTHPNIVMQIEDSMKMISSTVGMDAAGNA